MGSGRVLPGRQFFWDQVKMALWSTVPPIHLLLQYLVLFDTWSPQWSYSWPLLSPRSFFFLYTNQCSLFFQMKLDVTFWAPMNPLQPCLSGLKLLPRLKGKFKCWIFVGAMGLRKFAIMYGRPTPPYTADRGSEELRQ